MIGRRAWLAGTAGTGFALLSVQTATAQQADGPNAAIIQPANPGADAFIARAFEMRDRAVDLGDQPYGAAIVRDGRIVGQSWSRVAIDRDPTGHAEMAAIRDAARRLAGRSLAGAVMYSSSRPCPMCEAAAAWVGIDRMYHGRPPRDAGAPRLCRHGGPQ